MTSTYPQITRWAGLVAQYAAIYKLPADLVLAVIAQESSGNPGSCRPEPGFFQRYLPGLKRLVTSTANTHDDHWFQYPQLFSCSYGLMQVMYPVALELGMDLNYPTELCDPATGIEAGCRKLVRDGGLLVMDDAYARRVLLHFNGGGDPEYPDKVFHWRNLLAVPVAQPA